MLPNNFSVLFSKYNRSTIISKETNTIHLKVNTEECNPKETIIGMDVEKDNPSAH